MQLNLCSRYTYMLLFIFLLFHCRLPCFVLQFFLLFFLICIPYSIVFVLYSFCLNISTTIRISIFCIPDIILSYLSLKLLPKGQLSVSISPYGYLQVACKLICEPINLCNIFLSNIVVAVVVVVGQRANEVRLHIVR